jgi:nicotinamidase/pyrazinamidase
MQILDTDVLVVIDLQNDFCPGGALAVPRGDEVIEVIHRIATSFRHIVLTQDWHPVGHVSFASAHAGRKPFDKIETAHGAQTLWPDHCVQGSAGAEIHPALQLTRAELLLRKGFRVGVDSYSALFENDHTTPTGLGGYLRERDLRRVFLAGLAYDFCVGFSALDARQLEFPVIVFCDACRAIDSDGSAAKMDAHLQKAGVAQIQSSVL